MVYVIQLASRIRMEHSSVLILLASIYHCCVYSEKLLMIDRGCPKHVEFYSKK